MNTLSDKEISLLVELLNKCEPGNLSPGVFEAVARIAVYPAVEFIPLRKKEGRIEVLLLERSADDLIWPSMLHTPGTILRPTDNTMEAAFSRLFSDELSGLSTKTPVFIGAHLSRNSRGTCILLEHVLDVEGEPTVGTFYEVTNLPSLFIEEQRSSLERAVAVYRNL